MFVLCRQNAEVELYHNGSVKFETRSNGVNIFGECYIDDWFRNNNSGEGLYNQSTGAHWYSDGWNLESYGQHTESKY